MIGEDRAQLGIDAALRLGVVVAVRGFALSLEAAQIPASQVLDSVGLSRHASEWPLSGSFRWLHGASSSASNSSSTTLVGNPFGVVA